MFKYSYYELYIFKKIISPKNLSFLTFAILNVEQRYVTGYFITQRSTRGFIRKNTNEALIFIKLKSHTNTHTVNTTYPIGTKTPT